IADATGARATRPLGIHVSQAVAPVQVVTVTLPVAAATVPYTTVFEAAGGRGTYVWAVTGGSLPSGLALSAEGVLTGIPLVAGTSTFTVRASDARAPERQDSRTFSLIVAPPPNVPPAVSMNPV